MLEIPYLFEILFSLFTAYIYGAVQNQAIRFNFQDDTVDDDDAYNNDNSLCHNRFMSNLFDIYT